MNQVFQKSAKVFDDNVNWLLYSDIRIKKGRDKGALYGWKDLINASFPFIYSEVTGYAISCFSWMASKFGSPDALKAAQEASYWISKNLHSNLLVARPPALSYEDNDLSNVFYSFDNGMIMIGLLNLYKITKQATLLLLAEKMTQALIKRFFDGEKLTPRLDNSYNPVKQDLEDGFVKWSTVPGAYHCKLSIGLLELSRLTNNNSFAKISNLICEYAKRLQNSSGYFITNPASDVIYLHPHLYACEGLIYSGLNQSNNDHYKSGLNGIIWAVEQFSNGGGLALRRHTGKGCLEQSDCTAQLLRLLILCRSKLEKHFIDLDNIIERLHLGLLKFHISLGEGQGAMRYQLGLNSACSWCTMFSVQALKLWSDKNSQIGWIDYFV